MDKLIICNTTCYNHCMFDIVMKPNYIMVLN